MKKIYTALFLLFLFVQCEKEEVPPITIPIHTPPDTPVVILPNSHTSSQFELLQQPLSSHEAGRLAKNLGAADFVPTGIFIRPNESIDVSVSLADASTELPTILLGTYSRSDWNVQPREETLSETTPLTFTNTTLQNQTVYIRYAGATPGAVANVTITGGLKAPFFKLNETSSEAFATQLREYKEFTDVQLQGKRTFVNTSRITAMRYIDQDWEELMTTLDHIVETEEAISGLDNSSDIHMQSQNKYFLTESTDSRYWMAATSYRTFYNFIDAIDYVVDLNKLKDDGWGPWHELGHQHQLTNITWPETVEVTVNIFSLAVERSFMQESRLKRDNVWKDIHQYLKLPDSEKDYNDPDLGPFLRLGLYQQLWLQYGDNFFKNLHKTVREEGLTLTNTDDKMGYFMLKSSEISGANLTGFFREWGFVIDQSYFEALEALNLPAPVVDLTTLIDN